MGSFAERWQKADDNAKYKMREQSGLRAKINQCNKIFWREDGQWKAKIDQEIHTRNTWCDIVAFCLMKKYGILVEITKETPLTYIKQEGSAPILNEERFAVTINNDTMAHVKTLTDIDWQIIYQVLSKAAYHKDPLQQVPAAGVVLKKLNQVAKGEN